MGIGICQYEHITRLSFERAARWGATWGGEAGFQHSSSLGYQRPDDALKGVATKSKAYRRTLVQPGRAASGRRSQNGILESEIFTAATGRQSYRMETVRATVTAGV